VKALVLACIALALALTPAAVPASAGRPAPHYRNPTAGATPLVRKFFLLLQNKDAAGLKKLLSPAFQVQRADGSFAEKEDYLAKLPVVNKFKLTNLHATQASGTLIVRYLATVQGLVNGQPYTPGPAPRLSIFAWNGTRWQLAAHANFNPLKGY
jgi:hypothetical protein